ncbi:MAG: hypothetical protein ACR2NX_14525 [Chthoniobacterales bacterium]
MNAQTEFEPLHDGRTLHRIYYKMRMAPDHPLHWERECGILAIWLYAASNDDAVTRSEPILAALPFEKIVEQAGVMRVRRSDPINVTVAENICRLDLDQVIEHRARSLGSYLQFFAHPLGTGESELSFENVIGTGGERTVFG